MLLGLIKNPQLLPEHIDTAGILLRDDIVKYVTRVPEDEYITLDDNGMAEITEKKAAMHSQSLEEIADSICLHEIVLDLKELQARYRKMVEKMFSESEKGEE